MAEFFVYILASRSRRLYVGVTNNLLVRIAQHRAGASAFTARYRIWRLVHCEQTLDVRSAIAREKQLKAWTRAKRIALIEQCNPAWDDLAGDSLPDLQRVPPD
jgi:putative endonuclease